MPPGEPVTARFRFDPRGPRSGACESLPLRRDEDLETQVIRHLRANGCRPGNWEVRLCLRGKIVAQRTVDAQFAAAEAASVAVAPAVVPAVAERGAAGGAGGGAETKAQQLAERLLDNALERILGDEPDDEDDEEGDDEDEEEEEERAEDLVPAPPPPDPWYVKLLNTEPMKLAGQRFYQLADAWMEEKLAAARADRMVKEERASQHVGPKRSEPAPIRVRVAAVGGRPVAVESEPDDDGGGDRE